MEVKFESPKTLVKIDRGRFMDMIEVMSGTDPHEAFGMFCFMLSLIYRSVDEMTTTIDQYSATASKQIVSLINNPPEGFRDEDNEPTPGCEYPDCEAIREFRKERKARAH